MSLSVAVHVARAAVAAALVMSAVWKLRNGQKFRAVFSALVSAPLQSLDVLAARSLPWVEFASAGILLAAYSSVGQWAALGALALIGVFTLALARIRDTRLGCGCWGSLAHDLDRRFQLGRNLAMMIVAGFGSIRVSVLPWNELIFTMAIGLLLGLLLLELPQISVIAISPRTNDSAQILDGSGG